jgi:hypothetical protein
MGKKIRMRATWTIEYYANPIHYGPFPDGKEPSPQRMAEIDQMNDAAEFMALLGEKTAGTFNVEPV